jgi:hypothetical protein
MVLTPGASPQPAGSAGQGTPRRDRERVSPGHQQPREQPRSAEQEDEEHGEPDRVPPAERPGRYPLMNV